MDQEVADRIREVEWVLAYPEWQFIVEFTKKREQITTSVREPVALSVAERRCHRRRQGVTQTNLDHVQPLRTRVEQRVLGTYTVDAIATSERIERAFIPFLKKRQKGRVAAFWCVEDYHDKAAHAALFLGHLKQERGDIDWRAEIAQAAIHAQLHIGRLTAWSEQWQGDVKLARYLMKSMVPYDFNNPAYLLSTSSGVWDRCGMISFNDTDKDNK